MISIIIYESQLTFPGYSVVDQDIPNDVSILIVDRHSSIEIFKKKIFTAKFIGIDQEHRPTFKKGSFFPSSLLQIACEDMIFLIDLGQIWAHIAPTLKKLFLDKK